MSRLLPALLLLCAGCATPGPLAPAAPVRHVVPTAQAPAFRIAQGQGKAVLLLNAQTGASAASLSVLELQAGAQVPEHTHEGSVEMLYVEQGQSQMTVEGRTYEVKAGDAIYIPAGARHSARIPEGALPFRAVQVYVGPGPEQRFRQGEPLQPPEP